MVFGRKTKAQPFADEIASLERDIAATERAGPSLDERIAAAMARLDEAERHYRMHGLFTRFGGSADQRLHYEKLAMVGALMLTARKQSVDAETTRVRAQFDADGGMTEADKQERLASLRGELRKIYAKREIAWREQDNDEAFAERPGINADAGEMFLLTDADLKHVAEGRAAR